MARSPHQSIFSYNIIRRYPFRWFTPVALTGFLVFTAVFTFLNFISSGYALVVQETTDPNATISEERWFKHWPSFFTRSLEPTCQALDMPLQGQFFTNQTALEYTLTDIWLPAANPLIGNNGISPSLTYYNNIINNCTVTSLELDYSALDRTANQIAYSEWGITIRSYITCAVTGLNGTTFFNLTQEYDYVPPTESFSNLYSFLGTNFLERNVTTKSSLYWGESLLSMYWACTSRTMQDIRANQSENGLPGIRKGTVYFTPTTSSNITSLDFFKVDYRFIVDWGLGNFSVIWPGTYGEDQTYTSLSLLDTEQSYPNIWSLSDVLAKSAWSTVLTDLGQVNATPNILLDPDLLTYFTSNFSETRHHIANAYPGPSDQQYGTVGSGPLGTTPSVFDMKYLCQIPVRKSTSNLILGILVSDLVLLNVLWRVLTLGIGVFILRNKSDAHYCQGCVANESRGNRADMSKEVSIVRVTPSSGDQTEVEGLRPSRGRYSSHTMERQRPISAHQMEMEGLRPSRGRRSSDIMPRQRSSSQQRLIGEDGA